MLLTALYTLAILAVSLSSANAQDLEQEKKPAVGSEGLSIMSDEPLAPDAEAASEDPSPMIVVTGAAAESREVVVGSRIPRRATFNDGVVATSTGTRGLTPGSGMDQASGKFRIRRTETCISDNPAISNRDACLLVEAQDALTGGDEGTAKNLLLAIASDEGGIPATRLAAAELLYSIADRMEPASTTSRDADGREQALLLMLQSGAMPRQDDLRARRALVALALSDGRNDLAQVRLVDIVERDPDDARSMANLAILQRHTAPAQARSLMAMAIAAAERNGAPVPDGWRSFVAGD
ncbi:hypothetical protein G7A66_09010 [Altererythrobacter sp. SALINAS58]|uniref:hypothetical protein n=1 Tax=Alteripontixanthobacter muriae TaxID=2705546 RepID=UPI001576DBC5|nr:hypothetical protein [Alteripontixanthobacter muriae]NTZ43227.1 hypothetical protein [Alteripontixanthobacter muriae]